MLDSETGAEGVGFSTGALERGNYREAVRWLLASGVNAVELSALRFQELEPLVSGLDELSLERFSYISFHAPSSFAADCERTVLRHLAKVKERGWNIIVHPDVIYTPPSWRFLGAQLLIENMDRRKPIGRTPAELNLLFEALPAAMLCLDMAHARQMDTTLTLLLSIVRTFSTRIAQIHISELDSKCRHFPLSYDAIRDYQHVANVLNPALPVIIESMMDHQAGAVRLEELRASALAMNRLAAVV